MMSRHHDPHKPARRQNSLPDEPPPVRKVTIQQKTVQPLTTSVAATNNSDSFRRYPNAVSHDPSGRGHRGRHWAKPSRGVVANIVKDIDRGVVPNNLSEYDQRKMSDDSVRTGTNFSNTSRVPNQGERRDIAFKTEERISETSPRSGEVDTGASISNAEHTNKRNASGYMKMAVDTTKAAGQTKAISPVVPPKPKRKKVASKVENSVTKTQQIPMETEMRKQQDKVEVKPGISLTKILEKKAEMIFLNSQQVDSYVGKASETNKKTETKKAQVERRVSDSSSSVEERGLWENALQELKEKISERKVEKKPRAGLKNEDRTSGKMETAVTTVAEISKDELRTTQAENAVKSDMTRNRADLRNEEKTTSCQTDTKPPLRNSNSPSWVEERQLWEKAVKELQLVIFDKDLVVDNLSKVNRKLSEDIEYYEDTLRDWKGRDKGIQDDSEKYQRIIDERDKKIQELEVRITGDREGYQRGLSKDRECYQRIIDERDTKIQELEVRITGDKVGYQKMMDQREAQVRELEGKVREMRQSGETKARDSLELSHGSQNVLKTLGLKREKLELEKRVEELQERLRFYESQNQTVLQENSIGDKAFQEIPSLLYKFREGIDKKLQENAQVVNALEERLIKCAQNCQTLTKLNKNKRVFEDKIVKGSSQQVQSIPDLEETHFQTQANMISTLERSSQGDSSHRDPTLGDSILRDLTPGDATLRDFSLSDVENLRNLEVELQKEKMINEDLMERFIEIEELNNNYLDSIKSLESRAKDAEDLRVQTETLREQNEGLLSEMSELKENYSLKTKYDDTLMLYRQQTSALESQERETRELREKLVEDETLIEELREKVVEDDELIEELRANCQREEKWNREMRRNYEWELSTSAEKDDRMDEFQDCLWAREKLVRELQQQLDFEDKRCEELLEKLIASQREAEDFQEMCKDSRKKLEDSEERIKEFCDQNDRDAVTISDLTSENKQLRSEVEGLMKVRRNLEEDLERANGCLEAVEADKENFLTRQESEVKKLSNELEDKDFTNKGKEEVIEKLQENVVQLSANVQEMEFKMEERRFTLEEDLRKARQDLLERDKNLAEASGKYKELQEVCNCLRETISEKEGDVLDREAAMAHQREKTEELEKDIENLRLICGDNSTPLNNKPELVYTEAEMEEVSDFLEQERTLSEILRKQISFLENEIEEVKRSFHESKKALEEKDELITAARNEIKEHESLMEKTDEELNNLNMQLSSTKEELSNTKEELSNTKEELSNTKEELSNTKEELSNTKEELSNTKEELSNTKEELSNTKEELSNTKEELSNTKEELSNTKEELSNTKEELSNTKEELSNTKEELSNTKEELSNTKEELSNTKEDLSITNGELSKAKNELNSKENELDDNKTNTTFLQVDLTELDTKYHLLEAIKDNTENQLMVAREQLQKVHMEIKTLKGLNKELDGENQKMKERIRETEIENELQSKRQVLTTELFNRNEDEQQSEVLQSRTEDEITRTVERQLENELQSERQVLETELNELKEECKQILGENNELKLSLNELQAFNETVSLKNHGLQRKVEKLTDKWLRSEEKVRQAQITNVNLRYTLDEYISQSQDQIRHLKNHEREVATLTKHIHEMDVLVQGFKTALKEAVENENSEEKCVENDQNAEGTSLSKESGTQNEPCGTPETVKNTRGRISTQKTVKKYRNVENNSHGNEAGSIGTQSDLCATSVTRHNTEKTVSGLKSRDLVHQTDNESSAKTTPFHSNDSSHNGVSKSSQSRFEFVKTFHQKILAAKIPKNLILILIFLILVFCLGCTSNSIISRKYLFVFANSFVTLIFFALWVNELHKNKKYKAVDIIFGENFQTILRNDGPQLPHVVVKCENCGGETAIQNEEFHRYAKIKSSFQDLHEKFLEAVENSSKNTLPIQELYEKYEKLKDEVEVMKKERLEKGIMNTVSEVDEVSKNVRIFPENWNRAATILGKALVITLLCEVLYIRGIYSLPYAVNVVSFLLSLITFSYYYETIDVDATTREEPCATSREMELEQEIDELNHIIEKEHALVTTQREAIKALEKRLRKEFEKRIKQRNVLLKKLKYKGKLEDLRELLDNEENDEHKGGTNNQQGNTNTTQPVSESGSNGELDQSTDINSNNQTGEMKQKAGHGGDNNIQEGLTSGFNKDNDEYTEINESIEGRERINQEHKKLQEIITRAEKVSLDFEFIFSPMFFFLGLPLTGILLLCRYITAPVLMMVIQTAFILKETKLIKVESLPKVLQKNINPIIMDTIVVIYACILAVFLQCTQSIVVLVTCAIVQLAVHWWTSYRLAKKEDILQEITLNCLPTSTKQN